MVLPSADIFFKSVCLFVFFSIFFRKYQKSVKQFGSRSRPVGPDLGPNCLQRLSADDTSK